jgi:uncharacterized protein (TIGR03437 family)
MPTKHALLLTVPAIWLSLPALAQTSRITGKIDNSQRVTLSGHLRPEAVPQLDQGAVDPASQLSLVTVELKRSPAQQADLQLLLAQQQDPTSPNYHKWLTPDQFAERFGASQADINTLAQWLRNQHLNVTSTARSRNAISFSGTAAAVESAFGVELHHYLVNGQLHFANSTEPSVPAALAGVVGSIRGLNDFRLRPRSRIKKILPGTPQPKYTAGSGTYYLAPADIATIYNIAPLEASLNGSGQKLAVVGQTDIRLADIQEFRSAFNLPAINLQQVLVPGSADPGYSPGDLGESDLDLELSGAIATNAEIIFVYSTDVETSVQYAIDQNLAPIVSMSYGDCELAYTQSEADSMQALAQQANAQGMTWFAASGDNGVTDCYGDGFPGANTDKSVDMPGSIPEVTGVGGTEFNEGTGTYWSATNSANGESALGYIPEVAWNDTVEDGTPTASGGGASIYFTKPSWQTGSGVPDDGARDVPDIAISASADHDGYIIYSSDGCGERTTVTCEQIVGGTSVGAPQFSGIFTLLNQRIANSGGTPGLGNINPKIYSLAQSASSSYHEITSGNNSIELGCSAPFERGCTPTEVTGYSAGPGYNQVTGNGSVNADVLLTAWNVTSAAPAVAAAVNGASFSPIYAPGMVISVFGTQLASTTDEVSAVPLPTALSGVSATVTGSAGSYPAPIYYISPNQLNLQVPYEVPAGSASLTISNNGQTSAPISFTVAAAAPAIFTDSSGAPVAFGSAAPGETTTLFITGAGAVTPSIADGAAPASGTAISALPKPNLGVSVTVGGIAATTTFVGIPEGLVGVVQINYTVPTSVAAGQQPVVVTVGTAASPSATLTVVE